ncbi:inhibitor of trypsin and hageman factor-like [Tripterygium wilfordii]|uniref:inhibitor of trypsin and hageman factor-like n=1 Tax=Tripterygium wilfordii TaxID=458696 RepID=UPI0018F83416|nr:inhibitor of trypsin and hageman factor-like [Tripterygium wilfordii]
MSMLLNFVGLKVIWPELKGVKARKAKEIIEKENPQVEAYIVPEGMPIPEIMCCHSVFLYVSSNSKHGDYHDAPVVKVPTIGCSYPPLF